MHLSRQLLVFAFVGSIGFVIDAGILTVLSKYFSINLYLSRAISFSFASLATWLLNRMFTFRGHTRGVDIHSSEYMRYMLVQIGGAALNLLVFSILVAAYAQLGEQPVIPLAIGAVFGLAFNFTGARLWVYPLKEQKIG
jgi:putative flippase GtrA